MGKSGNPAVLAEAERKQRAIAGLRNSVGKAYDLFGNLKYGQRVDSKLQVTQDTTVTISSSNEEEFKATHEMFVDAFLRSVTAEEKREMFPEIDDVLSQLTQEIETFLGNKDDWDARIKLWAQHLDEYLNGERRWLEWPPDSEYE